MQEKNLYNLCSGPYLKLFFIFVQIFIKSNKCINVAIFLLDTRDNILGFLQPKEKKICSHNLISETF